MKGFGGQVGWALLFVFLIVLALFILSIALPIILRSIGLQEWGSLIDKLQNIQKYKDDQVTLSLPSYISSVGFYPGENGKCRDKDVICQTLCSDRNGQPLNGETFITISIDQSSKPSTLSVLWSAATFRINDAKAKAVQMAVTDMCILRDYIMDQLTSGTMTQKYMKSGALVLEGGGKTYCIKPQETSNGLEINVIREEACVEFAGGGGGTGGGGASSRW